MNKRLLEIEKDINNIMTHNYINVLINKYKVELEDYIYIKNVIDFSLLLPKGSIKYINKYDLDLRYGGLLIKIYNKNNKWYGIVKKYNNKRYNVSFENNYIFYSESKSNAINSWGKYFLNDVESGKYAII
jgi:hypothetical protein